MLYNNWFTENIFIIYEWSFVEYALEAKHFDKNLGSNDLHSGKIINLIITITIMKKKKCGNIHKIKWHKNNIAHVSTLKILLTLSNIFNFDCSIWLLLWIKLLHCETNFKILNIAMNAMVIISIEIAINFPSNKFQSC